MPSRTRDGTRDPGSSRTSGTQPSINGTSWDSMADGNQACYRAPLQVQPSVGNLVCTHTGIPRGDVCYEMRQEVVDNIPFIPDTNGQILSVTNLDLTRNTDDSLHVVDVSRTSTRLLRTGTDAIFPAAGAEQYLHEENNKNNNKIWTAFSPSPSVYPTTWWGGAKIIIQ